MASIEYVDAPELKQRAKRLIEKYPELNHCTEARIHYLFRISESCKYLGKCNKANSRWKHLTDMDFVLEFWASWWEEATDLQKEALLYHELKHIERTVKMKDDQEVVIWRTKKHDVELFIHEIENYGAWSTDLVVLKEAFKDK
jgi:hypothetical protein